MPPHPPPQSSVSERSGKPGQPSAGAPPFGPDRATGNQRGHAPDRLRTHRATTHLRRSECLIDTHTSVATIPLA